MNYQTRNQTNYKTPMAFGSQTTQAQRNANRQTVQNHRRTQSTQQATQGDFVKPAVMPGSVKTTNTGVQTPSYQRITLAKGEEEVNPQVANQRKYLNSQIEKGTKEGNQGLITWAQNELSKYAPKQQQSFLDIGTPEDLLSRSRNRAQNQFSDKEFANEMLRQRYLDKIGGLDSNDDIYDEQRRLSDIKYRGVFDDLINTRENAELRANQGRRSAENTYNDVLSGLEQTEFEQQQAAKANLSARGLANSSVLSNTMQQAAESRMAGQSEIGRAYAEQITTIDENLNNQITQLERRRGTLTQQQFEEEALKIENAIKDRDRLASQYNSEIDRTLQQDAYNYGNIERDAQQFYDDSFNEYAGLAREDRMFDENTRQFDEQMAQDWKKFLEGQQFTAEQNRLNRNLQRSLGSGGGGGMSALEQQLYEQRIRGQQLDNDFVEWKNNQAMGNGSSGGNTLTPIPQGGPRRTPTPAPSNPFFPYLR